MIIRFLGFTILLGFFTINANAQDEVRFDKISHDFGLVIMGDKPTYEFEFVNNGSDSVKLTKVKPSCGCTSPFWPKTPVPPGGRSKITVTYNSKGHPGPFKKQIAVTTDKDQFTTLYIKGVVENAPPVVEYTKEELESSPIFKLNKDSHFFGKIERNKSKKYSFVVKNEGKDTLTLRDLKAGCGCVTHVIADKNIAPGASTTLEITYFPRNLGNSTEIVTIFTNDRRNPATKLKISAEVVNSLRPQNMMREQGGFGF